MTKRCSSNNGAWTLRTCNWEEIARVGSPTTFYLDTSIKAQTTYGYRLATWNQDGRSKFTTTFVVTSLSSLQTWILLNMPEYGNLSPQEVVAEVNENGVTVLERYAYGLTANADHRPYSSETKAPGVPVVTFDPETKRLVAQFRRRSDAQAGLRYSFETSNDGVIWTSIDEVKNRASINQDWEEVTIEDTGSSQETRLRLGRVRVSYED